MPYPTTVMPRVSIRSRVAAMSRIDLTPADTTVIGVRASVGRSADSSKLSAACRCTPPRPPVAKTRMPARRARYAVAATVVAPLRPVASATGRSRTLTLTTSSSPATRTSSPSVNPTRTSPSSSATVAGVTPAARSCCSNERAASRLRGRGRPWLMMVDSSATTGRPAASASATGSATRTRSPRPSTTPRSVRTRAAVGRTIRPPAAPSMRAAGSFGSGAPPPRSSAQYARA